MNGNNRGEAASETDSDFRSLQLCWLLLIIICLVILITGCEGIPQEQSGSSVNAEWDSDKQTLFISGASSSSDQDVEIHDAANGSFLGKASIQSDGSWLASSSTAACEVHVDLPNGTATVTVKNAPSACTSSGLSTRVLADNDIPPDVLVVPNPQANNTIPNAVILEPAQDMVINVGQSINFSGAAIGSGTQPPFNFYWDFGGAASNSLIQNPGMVRFDIPGTYFIQLTASDNLGIPDPTPAVRTITVNGFNNPINSTPIPIITSPQPVNGNVAINVGESLLFSGSATDALGSAAFTYEWDFAGVYPNQFGASPGMIPFNRAGTFLVSLYATNSLGLRSVTPATVTVVVGSTSGVNQAPTGSIARPRNDVVIDVGESLNFRARGQDPDNDLPLLYSWDFQGVAPNIYMSTQRSTGAITFNTPGIYYITMTVTDSLGLSDPNPAVRVVTVQNTTVPPPPNTTLSAQILSPPSDVTITPGQSVFFSGQVVGSPTQQVLYFWSFDNAAVNSNLETPGNITFPTVGQFNVVFYATDISGNVLGVPATRVITVADPTNIEARIISPTRGTTVPVGTPISLIGEVLNNNGFSAITYDWTIKERGTRNRVFNSSLLSPGTFTFTQPGEYRVRFRVRGVDPFGNQTIASRDRVNITVTPAIPPIPPPNPILQGGGIVEPATDMVIYTGTRVRFEALSIPGADLNYQWDFGGARSPTTRRVKSVTFDNAGTYFVTLRITGTQNGLPIDIFDQRTISVMQQNPAFPPPGTNPIAGAGGIVEPITDTTINLGESVRFCAERYTGANVNVNYQWDFSGVRRPSTRRCKTVTFDNPGVFFISLQVTGTANGLPINVFDQRVITVIGPPIPTNPIAGTGGGIVRPSTDRVINVNDEITFRAQSFPGANVTYLWDFGGAAAPSTRRTKEVKFRNPGTYFVTLQIIGSQAGVPINIFDQRVITVNGTAAPPPTNPIAGGNPILYPSIDLIVTQGDTIGFQADEFAGANVNYFWDFSGAAAPSTQRTPSVTFNTVGSFLVTLQVSGIVNGVPISTSGQLTVSVVAGALPVPPPVTSPIAAGTGILMPATDLVINQNEQVSFYANTVNGANVNYTWDFGGAAAPSNQPNPTVFFTNPGTYFVSLQITGVGSNGVPINVFDQRIITVLQQGSAFPPGSNPFPQPTPPPVTGNSGPEGTITQPANPFVSIRVGEVVTFAGTGFDPTGNGALNFQWSFGGAQPNINSQNPGSISFNQPGTYVVTLLVSNSFGQYDQTPPSVVISVTP